MEKKNHYKKHEKLVTSWLLNAQKTFPNGRFFKRHVGLFITILGTRIYIGRKGQADLIGHVPYGKNSSLHLEIEMKTGKAVQTKEQKQWQVIVTNMRGFYCVIRDEHDMEQILDEIKRREDLLLV